MSHGSAPAQLGAAFRALHRSINLDSPQDVANATTRLMSQMHHDGSFKKEQAILTNMVTIKYAWLYVSRIDRKAVEVQFRGRRPLQGLIDLALKPLINGFNTPQKWVEMYTGKYFATFLQGITLFESERDSSGNFQIGRPAYHRPASCGPANGGPEYEVAHMDCTGVEGPELLRRRRNTWNCLLERKIYEAIYLNVFQIADQDLGHRYNFSRFQRDVFESCYPLIRASIDRIDLEWDAHAQTVPVAVTIRYDIQALPQTRGNNQFYTVIERYSRKFDDGVYHSDVFCQRSEIDTDGVSEIRRLHKTQSYFSDGRSPWIRTVTGGHRMIVGKDQGSSSSSEKVVPDPWMVMSSRKSITKHELTKLARHCRESCISWGHQK